MARWIVACLYIAGAIGCVWVALLGLSYASGPLMGVSGALVFGASLMAAVILVISGFWGGYRARRAKRVLAAFATAGVIAGLFVLADVAFNSYGDTLISAATLFAFALLAAITPALAGWVRDRAQFRRDALSDSGGDQ